jgi:glycerophosphoryl diester phosphodiesterase
MREILMGFVLFGIMSAAEAQEGTKVFGHRGCRAHYPENSIIGFQKAIEMGVDGIELDVVVNKDKQLVISHEPYFQSEFCLDAQREKITNEKAYNIYEMTREEILLFDCGSIGNPKFPDQQRVSSHKPLLRELFSLVDLANVTVLFEIKSSPKEYGKSQPEPEEYVQLILKELETFPHRQNIIFMSFDPAILNEINKQTQEFKMVYLTYLPFRSARKFLKDVNFQPFALGMFYPTVSRKKVRYLHSREMKLYTWTVNEEKSARKLIRLGVDGIITDRPSKMNLRNGR